MPRNLRFQVPFDFGSYWFLGEEKPWDLIHLRCALGRVSSWTSLYQNIVRRLKPDGVFEQVEIDLQSRWENGSHPVQRWYDTLLDATSRAGRSGGDRILPITPRPSSHRLKSRTLSRWYTAGLISSLEALSLGPFTQNLGWSAADVRQFVDGLRRILRETRDVNFYNNMHIVTARRPPENSSERFISCSGRPSEDLTRIGLT